MRYCLVLSGSSIPINYLNQFSFSRCLCLTYLPNIYNLFPGRYICSYLFYLVPERLFYFTIINHVEGSFADRAFEEYFDCRVKLDSGTILFSTMIELR